MGQLVTDSRLLAVSPYSSWVYLAGPKGSLPFFEKKPWTGNQPRLERGPGCPQRSCARVLAASGPIPFHPFAPRVPQSGCEPIGGPAFELLVLNGSQEHFQLWIPSYLAMVLGPFEHANHHSVCPLRARPEIACA